CGGGRPTDPPAAPDPPAPQAQARGRSGPCRIKPHPHYAARARDVDTTAPDVRPLLTMKSVRIETIQRPDDQGVFARVLLEGDKTNVRIIRLAAGEALPPHRHGASDLMLY